MKEDVRLGLSLVGGTAVWALYFSGSHALNSLACRWGWLGAPEGGGGLKVVQLLAAAVALVLLGASIYNCWRIWRSTRLTASADAGEAGQILQPGALEQTIAARTPLLAFVLLLLNSLYLLIVLISIGPVATLAACAG